MGGDDRRRTQVRVMRRAKGRHGARLRMNIKPSPSKERELPRLDDPARPLR